MVSTVSKLIIQIPCFNEEQALPIALRHLPRNVPGFDVVEWLVVDDGSTDNTANVASAHGVNHIVRHVGNLGLAKAFMTGIEASIKSGADVIVNTDADNQYNAADIPNLVAPIISGEAEIVVGARPIAMTSHFSLVKKILQRVGSWVVRRVSKTNVVDAPSGFRAFSRSAAIQLNVFNDYTYTLETLIQAGQKRIKVVSVPIRTNEELRPSRLVKSMTSYVCRSLFTIMRIFITYRPFESFAVPGGIIASTGFIVGLRFLYFFSIGEGQGHIQSVILAATMLAIGVSFVLIGIIADLISVNRKLLEKIDMRVYSLEEEIRQSRPHGVRNVLHAPVTRSKDFNDDRHLEVQG